MSYPVFLPLALVVMATFKYGVLHASLQVSFAVVDGQLALVPPPISPTRTPAGVDTGGVSFRDSNR